jgi:hypothetical protein
VRASDLYRGRDGLHHLKSLLQNKQPVRRCSATKEQKKNDLQQRNIRIEFGPLLQVPCSEQREFVAQQLMKLARHPLPLLTFQCEPENISWRRSLNYPNGLSLRGQRTHITQPQTTCTQKHPNNLEQSQLFQLGNRAFPKLNIRR